MTAKALRCRPTGCFVRLAGGIFFSAQEVAGCLGPDDGIKLNQEDSMVGRDLFCFFFLVG